ncbi:hypothetical protein [Marinobacterium sp. MBR-111]|jgi:hypothetical protein|uniref:hypothetical protein n=1 Tax=Marinobacterium sp. MBR-111 TaxID=3156463 RepID=UPI0033973ED5
MVPGFLPTETAAGLIKRVLSTVNAWGIKRPWIVIIIGFVFLLSGCGPDLCSSELLFENASPDKSYILTSFERNCGATTPYVRVLSLRVEKEGFDPDKYDDWIFTLHGPKNIKIEWNSNNSLIVYYPPTEDIPTKVEKWRNVNISYVVDGNL